MKKHGRQNKKADKNNNVGKGKVTEVQVAFIVDRYLSDNNLHQTRSTFRLEASSLLAKSSVQEAPKSLMSLKAILNEYILLKEKKVMVDQEKVMVDQEKVSVQHEMGRVQTLLHGMQAAMNAYNCGGGTMVPVMPASSNPNTTLLAGCPPLQTPTIAPVSLASRNLVNSANISSIATRKRKSASNVNESPSIAKRTHSTTNSIISSNAGVDLHPPLPHSANGKAALTTVSPPYGDGSNGLAIQGSRVAKCLFNQTVPSQPYTSPSPKTPPQATSSPSDKCTSMLKSSSPANCSNSYAVEDITPTHCTVISSQTVTVSPCKQGTIYSVQRNQIITSSPMKTNVNRANNRDHVKGRLNFDTSDAITGSDLEVQEVTTSNSDKDADFFDVDFPNLDAFGSDFSFTDLLDFDIDCGGIEFNEQSNIVSSPDNVSGASLDSGDCDNGDCQVMSSLLSTAIEVVPEKDPIVEGCSETLTTTNPVTKRIQIRSPGNSLDQNCSQGPLA